MNMILTQASKEKTSLHWVALILMKILKCVMNVAISVISSENVI